MKISVLPPYYRTNRSTLSNIREAVAQNRAFFGWTPKRRVQIRICDSAREFRAHCGRWYTPGVVGIVLDDGTIVVKSQRSSRLDWSKYRRILIHEMNHAFWLSARTVRPTPLLWCPIWVVEAFACFVARDRFLKTRLQSLRGLRRRRWTAKILMYRVQLAYFTSKNEIKMLYSVWYHFLRYLRTRAPTTFQHFVGAILTSSSRTDYLKIFKQHFSTTPERAFAEFCRTS